MDANEGKVYGFRPLGRPSADGSQFGENILDPWLVQAAIDDLRKRLTSLEADTECPSCRELQQSRDECDSLKRQRDFWEEKSKSPANFQAEVAPKIPFIEFFGSASIRARNAMRREGIDSWEKLIHPSVDPLSWRSFGKHSLGLMTNQLRSLGIAYPKDWDGR